MKESLEDELALAALKGVLVEFQESPFVLALTAPPYPFRMSSRSLATERVKLVDIFLCIQIIRVLLKQLYTGYVQLKRSPVVPSLLTR
jgi:hypothetical protein